MKNLTILWTNAILNGKVTNFNEVPKYLRPYVQKSLEDLGITIDEEGNFIFPEVEE